MNLAELADKIRSHWRPLPEGLALYTDVLTFAGTGSYPRTIKFVVGEVFQFTANEALNELLDLLPAPVTEEQRWTYKAIGEEARRVFQ